MTVCATESSADHENTENPEHVENADHENARAGRPGCVITADGAYAARLALDGGCWFPERWTLDGPEPYAVPLPSHQPEEPGTEVLPMGDGRVLIHRVAVGRHSFSLLYPTGPGTGELPLGAVECPEEGSRLRLLPPAPGGEYAYALAVGRGSTAVWLVAGGAFGPEHLAEIPGRCSGGVWLDGTGRMLALDRFQDGRTKTVVVDLERGGEVSPLLQIAEDSDDRLLLADADSGLLLIRSDAPRRGGRGWAGGAGEHAAGPLPGVPARLGLRGDTVRDPAGAGADTGALRGGPADRRAGRYMGGDLAARRASGPPSPGARGVVGGGGDADRGGRAPAAVRDEVGAVRGGAAGGARRSGGRGVRAPAGAGDRASGPAAAGTPHRADRAARPAGRPGRTRSLHSGRSSRHGGAGRARRADRSGGTGLSGHPGRAGGGCPGTRRVGAGGTGRGASRSPADGPDMTTG